MRNLLVTLTIGVILAVSNAFAAGTSSTTTTSSPSSFSKAKEMVENRKYKSAVPILEKFVKKQPNNADGWNLLAFSNRKLENFKVALQQYKTALRIDPEHQGANEYLGELYLKIGDLLQAKESLAILNRLCTAKFKGCSEYHTLKEKVSSY